MFLKQTMFLAIFTKIVTLEETGETEIFVVSSTHRPYDNVTTFCIQKQLELVAQMGEYDKKVSILEFQNNQLFKTLEEQKQIIEELNTKLQLKEGVIENIAKSVERYSLENNNTLSKLQEIIRQMELKETQNKEESNKKLSEVNENITRSLAACSFENNNTSNKLQEIAKRMDLVDSFQSLTTETLKRLQENNTRRIPRNCQEVKERGISTSGIYTIQPKTEAFTVLCDMDTKGGGWTVIQNRFDGSQNFDLDWKDYKKGFGSLKSEFWLGLDYIYQLAGERYNELYIELVDQNRKKAYAYFDSFRLDNEEEGYKIHVLEQYAGDAGNSLFHHHESKFSTKDMDQDNHSDINCASIYGGGWWYRKNPGHTNLNSKYLSGSTSRGPCGCGFGINWYKFSGDVKSLRSSKMMMRLIQ